jgi:dihydroxyacetone kinase-like protein
VDEFAIDDVKAAVLRAAEALDRSSEELTRLDQALGDGDLGVTAEKAASALRSHVTSSRSNVPGPFLIEAGMAVNRVASSTIGTLMATALMRAGKALGEKPALDIGDLALMLDAADEGVKARGKARLGDKTVVDALHPAAKAFRRRVEAGDGTAEAAAAMLQAARAGRDGVTPLRSKVGRAGWVGERTEGAVDPGCQLLIVVFEAMASAPSGPV